MEGVVLVEIVMASHYFVLTGRNKSSESSEQTFLQRLLEKGATESSTSNGSNGSVEAGLCSRKASAAKTIKSLVQNIDCELSRNEELVTAVRNGLACNGKDT